MVDSFPLGEKHKNMLLDLLKELKRTMEVCDKSCRAGLDMEGERSACREQIAIASGLLAEFFGYKE